MAALNETDLYAPIKKLLEERGYTVRAEVDRCDLVAVRGGEPPVIVELKRRFALALVYQGIERQRITDAVYLAVAAPAGGKAWAIWNRKHGAALQLCRRLGLGLMTVDAGNPCAPQVDVHLDPAPYAPRKSRARREHLLGEFARRVADHNVGGSHARPIMTAYRQDALRCAHCLASDGPLRAAAVRRYTCVASAARILQRNVYRWFERVERGVYRLTPRGRTALDSFAEMFGRCRSTDREWRRFGVSVCSHRESAAQLWLALSSRRLTPFQLAPESPSQRSLNLREWPLMRISKLGDGKKRRKNDTAFNPVLCRCRITDALHRRSQG
jgi:hypothetical protein